MPRGCLLAARPDSRLCMGHSRPEPRLLCPTAEPLRGTWPPAAASAPTPATPTAAPVSLRAAATQCRASASVWGARRQELEGLVLPSPAGRSWATPPPRVPALRHQPAPASDCRGPRGPLIPELTVGVSTASHVAVTVPFSTFGEPAVINSL